MPIEPDVPLALAWTLAWGTLAMVALLVLALLLLRWWRWREQPIRAAFEARWRPLLMQCALGDEAPAPLPRLARRERWHWLQLWLHLQMSLEGPSRQRLAALGRAMGATELALTRVHSAHQSERLVGLLALGFLQDAEHEPLLLQVLAEGHSQGVVYAARALLETDAERHASAVVQALLACTGVDLALLSVMLKPFRRVLHGALVVACPQPVDLSSLPALRVARALQLQLPQAWLAPCLASAQDSELLMAALRLVQGEQGAHAVQALALHTDWRVRAQAARVLADVGTRADVPLLVGMTADAQWWVRYRAAQALLRLPGVGPQEASHAVQALGDRYALSMLQAVLAEEAAQGRGA